MVKVYVKNPGKKRFQRVDVHHGPSVEFAFMAAFIKMDPFLRHLHLHRHQRKNRD